MVNHLYLVLIDIPELFLLSYFVLSVYISFSTSFFLLSPLYRVNFFFFLPFTLSIGLEIIFCF